MEGDRRPDSQPMINKLVGLIARLFPFTPSSLVISQVQLAVERLTFSAIDSSLDQDEINNAVHESLDGSVDPDVMAVILSLTKHGLLDLLRGEYGRMLVAGLIKYYQQINECEYTTAIPLDKATKKVIVQKLNLSNSDRCAFRVSPDIVAGFIYRDPRGVVNDFSLATSMQSSTRRYVESAFNKTIREKA